MDHEREVWRIARAGSLDALRKERETLPAPGPGQVRIDVGAIGLNLADVFACLGLYSATPAGPFIPGLEMSGVVEQAGDVVEEAAPSFRRGDRVIALTRFGGYATALNADVRYVRPLPEGWSLSEGAAFSVQALTAWYALRDLGRLKAGEVVLVHSAAGGVGLNALALVAASGARAIATVRSEAKRDFLLRHARLAPHEIIVRDRRRFAIQLDEALKASGAEGLDIVLDGVAGPYFFPAFSRLRPEGRHIIFGASDMMPAGSRTNRLALLPRYLRRPRLDPMRLMSSNRSVAGFNLIWLWDRTDRLSGLYDEVAAVLKVPPLVGREFAFDEARSALAWLKSGESVGKVVLTRTPVGARERIMRQLLPDPLQFNGANGLPSLPVRPRPWRRRHHSHRPLPD